jgi:hypothetical protein
MRLAIDWHLDELIEKQGGFSTTLSYGDRQKLRAVVKKVHMRHFPTELISDYEADRMIDVIAPGTAAYLIRRAYEERQSRDG